MSFTEPTAGGGLRFHDRENLQSPHASGSVKF